LNNDFGTGFDPAEQTTWEFDDMIAPYHPDPKAYIVEVLADPELFGSLPLILSTKILLTKIRGLFRGLHVVTSRPEVLKDVSRQWLDQYGIPYDKLIFTHDKGKYCHDQGASYIIEDAPHHAEDCHSYGIGVFLIDKPYNREVRERGGLWRVKHPMEIHPLLLEDLKTRKLS
jgi:5'(3')-deoxyribonucleotidase